MKQMGWRVILEVRGQEGHIAEEMFDLNDKKAPAI